jgi:hypothetical protein
MGTCGHGSAQPGEERVAVCTGVQVDEGGGWGGVAEAGHELGQGGTGFGGVDLSSPCRRPDRAARICSGLRLTRGHVETNMWA